MKHFFKSLSLLKVIALTLIMLGVTISQLEAKSYSSGYKSSSFKSSSSSSSSSSNYSSSYKSSSSSKATTPSNSGYKSSYGSSSTMATTSSPSTSKNNDNSYSQVEKAKNDAYKNMDSKKALEVPKATQSTKTTYNEDNYKTNTKPSSSYNSGSSNSNYGSQNYSNNSNYKKEERENYQNYSNNIPNYYNQNSNYNRGFGDWNGFMMGYLISDAFQDLGRFFYHNSNDKGIQEWKKELEKEAQTNEILKAKLDKANEDIAKLTEQNVSKETFIPKELTTKVEKNDYNQAPNQVKSSYLNEVSSSKKEEKDNTSTYLTIMFVIMGLGLGYHLFFVRKYS